MGHFVIDAQILSFRSEFMIVIEVSVWRPQIKKESLAFLYLFPVLGIRPTQSVTIWVGSFVKPKSRHARCRPRTTR